MPHKPADSPGIQMDDQNGASAADGRNTFLEHMAAQLKVLNVEIIPGAILPTAWEVAAAEKCHFTYAANESTIKWLWRPKQPAV